MRKAVMIVGAVVAVVVIVIAAVLIYAARNLNSIIAERQPELLQKVSDSLGRKVEVASIKASLGWGLVAELTGLKIGDDPALSDRPFVEASEASAKVELLPLLVAAHPREPGDAEEPRRAHHSNRAGRAQRLDYRQKIAGRKRKRRRRKPRRQGAIRAGADHLGERRDDRQA